MKRFSIFLVAMLVAVSASAQLVTSSSSMKVKTDRTTWVMRASLGINNFSFGEDYEGKKSKIGYNFDWSFNRKMGNQGAYWGMGWGIGSRGYKVKSDEGGHDYKYSHSANNIHYTPFIFGWKIKCGNSKVAIDPHAAIYLACDYIGKVKEEYTTMEWQKVGTEYVDFGYGYGTYEDKYEEREAKYDEDWSIWDEDDYMPFDIGLKVGVGVWFNNKFNVDFTYQRGLMPAFMYEEADYGDGPFTSNFLISVGVGF